MPLAESSMKPEEKELVLGAQKALKLRDIKLYSCALHQNEHSSDQLKSLLKEQLKHGIRYAQAKKKLGEKEIVVLLVHVDLGIRVGVEDEKKEFAPIFTIEASYLVEYQIKEDVSDDALAAFSKYNVVHNVWPFWRQHVFDAVSRARLPHTSIPFFPGEDI